MRYTINDIIPMSLKEIIQNHLTVPLPLGLLILDYLNVKTLFAVSYCVGEWYQVEIHSERSYSRVKLRLS